ncbi:MAG: hypothetical protein HY301_02850 [Verrucomicrobia bacterium]|nr:hypothetical protein [Verrucomicrobiota bacterium]
MRAPLAPHRHRNVAFVSALWLLFVVFAGTGLAQTFTAGLTNPGSTTYLSNGLRRLNQLTLSQSNYGHLYCAVYDPATGYGYFTSAGAINPGWVVKVDLNGPAPVERGATNCAAGELNLDAGVLDSAAGVAYFGTTLNPAKIVKIGLGTGTNPPSYLGSITFSNGENLAWGAVLDDSDPNPSNHFAYFACGTAPSRIVKVALGTFKEIGSLTLAAGEDNMRRGLIDTANGYAYFAGPGIGAAATPKVVKVALGAGTNPPVRIGAVTLDAISNGLGAAVIDLTNGFAYVGTYLTNVPSKIFKVALGAGTNPPTGQNVQNSPPSLYGEVFLQSAVMDAARGYAYWGTDSGPGTVVKTAYSQKSVIKGMKISLASTSFVADVRFYSHAALGNVRLALYDNAAPKNLLWQSAPLPDTATSNWLTAPISSGSPLALILNPGTYWLAWQVDTTADVPSYTAGVAGDGFLLDTDYGAFAATLSGETNTTEKWSVYLSYTTNAPLSPVFTLLIFQNPNGFGAQAVSTSNTAFRVLASTNLVDWFSIATNIVSPGGLLDFLDADATNFLRCFYRFVWP